MTAPELHPALAPISFLIGTWAGEGAGEYPTIDAFSYVEEVSFWHTGRPWLGYVQKTKSPEGAPMHSESGYIRPQNDGKIEAVLGHAFGAAEILEGTIEGSRIELESVSLTNTSSAKTIESTRRVFRLSGDELIYEVEMAYGGHPLRHHLSARLKRT